MSHINLTTPIENPPQDPANTYDRCFGRELRIQADGTVIFESAVGWHDGSNNVMGFQGYVRATIPPGADATAIVAATTIDAMDAVALQWMVDEGHVVGTVV